LKILSIIPSVEFGGAEKVLSTLIKEWSINNSVKLITFHNNTIAYKINCDIENINCPPLEGAIGKIRNIIKRTRLVCKIIYIYKPDIIISFLEPANIVSILSVFITKKMDLLTISIRNNPDYYSKINKLLIKCYYPRINRIVAVSNGIKNKLIQSYNIKPESIEVIYNPIDINTVSKKRLLKPLDTNLNNPYILGIGRLVEQKQFEKLIIAFSMIKKDNIDLIIIGEGPLRASLYKLIESLNLQNSVKLIGNVANPYYYLSNAELFVLSSKFEGWPNVIMEAFACDCPVVSFDCPYGPDEIIENGKNGILVPTGDINKLSNTIYSVINNNNLRKTIKTEGKKSIKRFGIKSTANKWLYN